MSEPNRPGAPAPLRFWFAAPCVVAIATGAALGFREPGDDPARLAVLLTPVEVREQSTLNFIPPKAATIHDYLAAIERRDSEAPPGAFPPSPSRARDGVKPVTRAGFFVEGGE